MGPDLFQSALDEAIRFGPSARLVLTFPGGEDELPIQALAYTRVGESGFRVEIRVSDLVDSEIVDDVVFVDARSIETVELQVKQQGKVWQDERYEDVGEEDMDR